MAAPAKINPCLSYSIILNKLLYICAYLDTAATTQYNEVPTELYVKNLLFWWWGGRTGQWKQSRSLNCVSWNRMPPAVPIGQWPVAAFWPPARMSRYQWAVTFQKGSHSVIQLSCHWSGIAVVDVSYWWTVLGGLLPWRQIGACWLAGWPAGISWVLVKQHSVWILICYNIPNTNNNSLSLTLTHTQCTQTHKVGEKHGDEDSSDICSL